MWKYEKKLQYPVNIKSKNLKIAKALLSQYGGPDGEFGAAIRYLNQRYTMPDEHGYALLTDIGTEELAHVEMIATMIIQILKNATPEELVKEGLMPEYVEHNHAVFPMNTAGNAFTASYIETSGNWNADLSSDMAAEQRARVTYENLMTLTNENDILAPLAFLRQREIVHYERFKELREYYINKYNKEKNNKEA